MVVPVRIEGPEATIFSRLKRSQVRRRWFPKITVTVLEPVRLNVDPELKGRKRRQAAGAALYTIMSDLIFRTTSTDRTVFEALIDAAKIHGPNWLAIEGAPTGSSTWARRGERRAASRSPPGRPRRSRSSPPRTPASSSSALLAPAAARAGAPPRRRPHEGRRLGQRWRRRSRAGCACGRRSGAGMSAARCRGTGRAVHWEFMRREAFVRWPVQGNVLEALREGRLELGPGVLLEPGVWITAPGSARVRIGAGSFLNIGVMVAAQELVEIGEHCMLANGCFVSDADHRFDDPQRPDHLAGLHQQGPHPHRLELLAGGQRRRHQRRHASASAA